MSWTRSARQPDGKFTFEVTDWHGRTFAKGERDTYQEAERAAEAAERAMTLAMMHEVECAECASARMSDDELLRELMG